MSKTQEFKAYGSIRKMKVGGACGVILALAMLGMVFSTTVSADGVRTIASSTAPDVTEKEVTDAKTKADQATKAVKTQETKVEAIEVEKTQAQQSLVNAITAVKDAEKLASEATPEGLTKAQEAVKASQSAVTNAQAELEAVQESESKAKEAVEHQREIVAKASQVVTEKEATVTSATQAVDQAKAALTTSNQAADVSVAEEKMLEAQKAVTKAETQVSKAKEVDAKHESDVRHAKEELDLKSRELSEKQTTLEKVMVAIEAERLTKPVENGTYFNQRDNKWQKAYGGKTFAATGCVPVSLAMAFSELLGRQITPLEVADYLYQIGEFNNDRFDGTSSVGAMRAAEHFGLVPTVLKSLDQVQTALQDGHYVISSVQHHEKFAPLYWGWSTSHDMALRGYQNGDTYVYDPYNRNNIGYHNLADLWNHQSHNPEDVDGVGVPFISLMTKQMAQLMAQKVTADQAVELANQALTEVQASVTDLEQVVSQTPQAKDHLAEAKTNLVTAKDMLDKAKQRAKLAEQDLETKTANLKQVTKLRKESQDKVSQAKVIFNEASARLGQELETLKILQAKEAELTAQYQATKHRYQLVESKAKIEAKGEDAVPVVNEMGHVTHYVSGKTQLADTVSVRTEEKLSKVMNTSSVGVEPMVKQGHQKVLNTDVTSHSSLPQTGEQSLSLLSVLGMSFLSLLSFLGLRMNQRK